MSYRPCPCKSWGTCSGYKYYEPGEVAGAFCRNQVIWMIDEVLTLDAGEWPSENRETGYTNIDPDIRTEPRPHTPRALIMTVRGELERRIACTKGDGRTLVEQIRNGQEKALTTAARQALGYCCGRDIRVETYPHWLHKRDNNPHKNGLHAQT